MHTMKTAHRQVAANFWTKLTSLSHKSTRIGRQPVNCIHHHDLLLLLYPKTDTQLPQRVEGRVDFGENLQITAKCCCQKYRLHHQPENSYCY